MLLVGIAQSLTDALINELGRSEEFHLNLAGGLNGRTTRAVFHDAHFADELPRANRAEQDGIAIEFSEYGRYR